jgi:hypothetical protein
MSGSLIAYTREAAETGRNRKFTEDIMNDTKIVNIKLIAAIEELESKIAPSGAVTLGD